MEKVTVRELSGELWAEVNMRLGKEIKNYQIEGKIADVALGVIARHVDEIIVQDKDLPVEPLEKLFEDE